MAKKKTAKRNSPRKLKSSPVAATVFRDIGELYTLEGVALKGGRRACDNDLGRIDKAALVARGGRIEWIGRERDLPREYAKRGTGVKEEGLGGMVVIPAFVESHTHTVFAGNRAGEFDRRNRGESYQAIAAAGGGILSTVRSTRAASEVSLRELAQARIDRFVTQGVTTVEVKSGYALNADGELKMLRAAGALKGARIVRTFLGAHAIPQESRSAEDYVDHLIEKVLPRVKREGLACRVDIFIENGYFSSALANRYFEAASDLGFDLVAHADQLTLSGGAELAVRMRARSADHLLRIAEADIQRLAKSEVTCVLLPSADLYMKCPYPPARALIEAGARVALATDFNPGSAPSQDLALVGVLARIEMKMSLAEVIAAYTVGGAHALGLGGELGSLSKGKLCDFCGLEGGLDELFLEVGRQPVKRVYRESRRLR